MCRIFFCLLLLLPNHSMAKNIFNKQLNNGDYIYLSSDGFINFSATTQQHPNHQLQTGIDGSAWLHLQKTNSNNKFGFNLKIESNQQHSPLLIIDQAYISYKNHLGTFELGNYFPANQQLKQGPSKITRGAGGINGKYLQYIKTNSNDNAFILLPQSPIAHGSEAMNFQQNNFVRSIKDNSFDRNEDANKISYYTNKNNNLQAGFSYTANSKKSGLTNSNINKNNTATIANIISIGLAYDQDFDNLNIKLATTGEKGKVLNRQQMHDLSSYDIGGVISYFGIKIAKSYGSWGKSLQSTKSGKYNSNAIAYNIGPFAASISNFNSNFANNKYYATSLGLDYKIKKNLLSYIEYTNFGFKISKSQNSITSAKDHGFVVLTGILFNF